MFLFGWPNRHDIYPVQVDFWSSRKMFSEIFPFSMKKVLMREMLGVLKIQNRLSVGNLQAIKVANANSNQSEELTMSL